MHHLLLIVAHRVIEYVSTECVFMSIKMRAQVSRDRVRKALRCQQRGVRVVQSYILAGKARSCHFEKPKI